MNAPIPAFDPLLIPVILGLVEFLKKLGLRGNYALVASMFIGVLFSVAYQLTAAFPQTPSEWMGLILKGLVYGLATSGIYDFADARWPNDEA